MLEEEYSYRFSVIIVQRDKFKLLSPIILLMHFDIRISFVRPTIREKTHCNHVLTCAPLACVEHGQFATKRRCRWILDGDTWHLGVPRGEREQIKWPCQRDAGRETAVTLYRWSVDHPRVYSPSWICYRHNPAITSQLDREESVQVEWRRGLCE